MTVEQLRDQLNRAMWARLTPNMRRVFADIGSAHYSNVRKAKLYSKVNAHTYKALERKHLVFRAWDRVYLTEHGMKVYDWHTRQSRRKHKAS